MKRHIEIILAVLLSSAVTAHADGEWQKGMLIRNVFREGVVVGTPGQVVRFRELPRVKVEIALDKDTTVEELNCTVKPYDKEITPSIVFLYLSMEKDAPGWCYKHPRPLEARFLLAKAVASEFPNHPLHEEMLAMACDFSIDYEAYVSDGKSLWRDTISLINEYLAKYPNGRYKDRLEWKKVQLQNGTYEYEGRAHHPLKEINAFNKYLKSRPDTKEKDNILLRLARLHRIVYECVTSADKERMKAGLTEKEAKQHLKNAVKIYKKLIHSKNLKARHTARVALYNIEKSRATYSGIPGDW
jgi:hypothetical protein